MLERAHLAAVGLNQLLADVQAKPLPGTANQKMMDLAGMLLTVAILVCVAGLIICGAKMAVSFHRGQEFSEMGKLPIVVAGCIIVGSAAAIGQYFMPTSNNVMNLVAKALPGESNTKMMDLAGMLLTVAILVCIAGLIICGAKMAVAFGRGQEMGEMGKLPVVVAGCILVGSASALGSYFLPASTTVFSTVMPLTTVWPG